MTDEDRAEAIDAAINNVKVELSGIEGIVEMLDRSISAGYSRVMTEELAKCLLRATSDLMTLAIEIKYNAERIKFNELDQLVCEKEPKFRIEDYIKQNKTR